jgi:hypothetical protein
MVRVHEAHEARAVGILSLCFISSELVTINRIFFCNLLLLLAIFSVVKE